MQFHIAIIATALVGMTFASPTVSDLVTRAADSAVVVSINGEALSPDVSISCILNCAEVLASAVCIVAGIEAENVAAVEACGDFGVSKLCSCGKCIPVLGPFLTRHHVC